MAQHPADARTHRLSGKYPEQQSDPRKPFQIDRDRILYSNAFRRLAGVTQVVSPGEGEIFHNRLTHSLKVAQIARRIAEVFCEKHQELVEGWGGLDLDVCEAAALAHDLGHPPFGHIAEKELEGLVSTRLEQTLTADGYEGNAQSFRILTALSTRHPDSTHALDLTRATLNATLKYPWRRGKNPHKPKKYGAYLCDDASFQFARTGADRKLPYARSLEAQIMDWADDITYSVHDTEDFYRAGLIPLDRLASNPTERSRFRNSVRQRGGLAMDGDFDQVFDGLFNSLRIRDRYEGTAEQQRTLYSFCATKIGEYVRSTKLVPNSKDGKEGLDIPKPIALEVALLKQLTWTYVIENPALAAHQYGQKKAIRKLFEVFDEAAQEANWVLFPAFFRERGIELEKAHGKQMPVAERVRLVADTIASMTDRQALIVYHQLTGVSSSSMLDPVMS